MGKNFLEYYEIIFKKTHHISPSILKNHISESNIKNVSFVAEYENLIEKLIANVIECKILLLNIRNCNFL